MICSIMIWELFLQGFFSPGKAKWDVCLSVIDACVFDLRCVVEWAGRWIVGL